jgi:hypothetical protein
VSGRRDRRASGRSKSPASSACSVSVAHSCRATSPHLSCDAPVGPDKGRQATVQSVHATVADAFHAASWRTTMLKSPHGPARTERDVESLLCVAASA